MLGQGLSRSRQYVAKLLGLYRDARPDVAIDIDRGWVTCFEIRLASTLHADDVWFQLQVEAATLIGVTPQEVAFDFTSDQDAADVQVLHRVFAVPHAWMARVQAAVIDAGLHLSRLGVCDSQSANGQECAAINFLPHRQMRLQQHKRQFAWRCAAALFCGIVLTSGAQAAWVFWLMQTGVDAVTRQQAQQKLNDAQVKHDAVQLALQQHTQWQSQRQARQRQQEQTTQWQAVLQTNRAAVWYERLMQEGGAWRLSGQALTKTDVQQLQSQLARLPIWQTSPTLKHWAPLPPQAQIRLPLWQFELVADLHDATLDGTAMPVEPAVRVVP